ncbi:MAG: hypothetical protein JNJ71_06640 [Rubrivivax sp.]|nr:hypothetical protein [Rubrivivax sp.]
MPPLPPSCERRRFVLAAASAALAASGPARAGPAGSQWQHVPGQATDIGVGGGADPVWALGVDAVRGGREIFRFDGRAQRWVQQEGGAVAIDVSPDGTPWVVTDADRIYKLEGGRWRELPGRARDIGIGANGTVWVIGNTPADGGFSIHRLKGNDWERVRGGAARIDVDRQGNAWVLNTEGEIFRWNSKDWDRLPGRARDIGCGADGSVWVIGPDQERRGGHGIHRWDEGRWVKVDGAAEWISVGPQGLPWVITAEGQIYRRV